jgi:hypothetical protein
MQTVTSINAATFTPRFLQHEGRAPAAWTAADLVADSKSHRGTGGVSEENEGFGFRPAFLDAGTGIVYRSRFQDGTPAPFHLLDGLPEELVASRNGYGRVAAVKAFLISGFVRLGRFYTRDEAAAVVSQTLPAA